MTRRYWRVAHKDDKDEEWNTLMGKKNSKGEYEGFIAQQWSKLGSVKGMNKAQIFEALESAYPEFKTKSNKDDAKRMTYLLEMNFGDIVVVNKRYESFRGYGVVTGTYYASGEGETYRHRVPVRWINTKEVYLPKDEKPWKYGLARVGVKDITEE